MSDPVFKGCTRPAMLGGVPLLPLMLVVFPLLLIGVWGLWLKPIIGIISVVSTIPTFIVMKIISKFDDQRLMQHLLRSVSYTHLDVYKRQPMHSFYKHANR